MKPEASPCRRPRVVGISDMIVSSDPDEVLVTYSLGSCLGVAVWDGVSRIAGLIHCLLPTSKGFTEGNHDPARFVDQGLLALLQRFFDAGTRREDLIIKVAGGGSPLHNCEGFRIGERNQATLRKVLWKNKLLIAAERVGGSEPRTLTIGVADGRTTVRSNQREEEI